MLEIDTVLLVEDDASDVLLMRRAFERANVRNPLHVAHNGEEAIEYLSGAGAFSNRSRFPRPALVLLDLHLPTISGFEVLEWIRGDSNFRTVPVVVLTSSRSTPDIQRAYDAGANSYLLKPPQFDELAKTISTFRDYWMFFNQSPPQVQVDS